MSVPHVILSTTLLKKIKFGEHLGWKLYRLLLCTFNREAIQAKDLRKPIMLTNNAEDKYASRSWAWIGAGSGVRGIAWRSCFRPLWELFYKYLGVL